MKKLLSPVDRAADVQHEPAVVPGVVYDPNKTNHYPIDAHRRAY